MKLLAGLAVVVAMMAVSVDAKAASKPVFTRGVQIKKVEEVKKLRFLSLCRFLCVFGFSAVVFPGRCLVFGRVFCASVIV